MKFRMNYVAQINKCIPSKKRLFFTASWSLITYFVTIPLILGLVSLWKKEFKIAKVVIDQNNSDTVIVDAYMDQLRMIGGLKTSAYLKFLIQDKEVGVSLPEKKWNHLERLRVKEELKLELDLKEISQRKPNSNNKIKVVAIIKLSHVFNISFNFHYHFEIDLGKNESGSKNFLSIQSIKTKEQDNKLQVDMTGKLDLPENVSIFIKNLEMMVVEEYSGEFGEFDISIDGDKISVRCFVTKKNIDACRNLINRIENLDNESNTNAIFKFVFNYGLGDNHVYNLVRLVLENFLFIIPRSNGLKQTTLEENSIKVDINSSEEDGKIINFTVKVHERLFPSVILFQTLQHLKFEDIAIEGKVQSTNLLSGKVSQASKYGEKYLSLNLQASIHNKETWFSCFFNPRHRILSVFPIVDSMLSRALSLVFIHYNFRDRIEVSSLDYLKKIKRTCSKQKFSGETLLPLIVKTNLSSYRSLIELKNSFESLNQGKKVLSIKIKEKITLNLDGTFIFRFNPATMYIDVNQPIEQSISLSKKLDVYILLNSRLLNLNYYFKCLNKYLLNNSSDKNKVKVMDIFETIYFKLSKVHNLTNYLIELNLMGKPINRPFIDYSFSSTEDLTLQFDINKGDDGNTLIKWNDDKNENSPTSLKVRINNPSLNLLIGKGEVCLFPVLRKNEVLIEIIPNDVLYYPNTLECKNVENENIFSAFITNIIKSYQLETKSFFDKVKRKRNEYPPIKNFSLSQFNLLSSIYVDLSSNSETAVIQGNIKIFYDVDQTKNEEHKKSFIIGESQYFVPFPDTLNEKFVDSEEDLLKIYPLKLVYGRNYIQVSQTKIIPTCSNNIYSQPRLETSMTFSLNILDFVDQRFPVQCFYGNDSFEFQFNHKFFVSLFENLSKNSPTPDFSNDLIHLMRKHFYINHKIIHSPKKCEEITEKMGNICELSYRGHYLKYIKKLPRIIRRINFSSYPKTFGFFSKFYFQLDGLTLQNEIESEIPLNYETNKLDSIQITISNPNPIGSRLNLTRKNVLFIRKVLASKILKYSFNSMYVFLHFMRLLVQKVFKFCLGCVYYISPAIYHRYNMVDTSYPFREAFPQFDFRIYANISGDASGEYMLFYSSMLSDAIKSNKKSLYWIIYNSMSCSFYRRTIMFRFDILIKDFIFLSRIVNLNILEIGRWWIFFKLLY